MILSSDLNETIDYILKDDTDNPTVWKLGVISKYLFAKVAENSMDNKIDIVYKILQIGIKGWTNSNIPFETNKEKIFGSEMEVVPLSVLERFPLKAVTELSMKIMEINQLSEGERKN